MTERPAPVPAISLRKSDHVRINLGDDVAGKGIDNGFSRYRFDHRALPGIALSDVDTSLEILGRRLAAPLLISCMTGGTPEARAINRTLAAVAQRERIALGLGSGRALLEHPELLDSFDVRDVAPDVLLFANLGAVQLNKGIGANECSELVRVLRADALVLHLNPLQEALQPEGDTDFRGLREKIAALCAALEFPVIVKEVGWGINAADVRALIDAGVAAVDVAGAGGTSWSEVERHRLGQTRHARVAAAFAGWGIATADALIEARSAAPDALLFASGGIADGLHVAKALALGADLVGIAGPFLRAAAAGEDRAWETAREIIDVLRVSMFVLGVTTLEALRASRPLHAIDR